ncbi:hypothetical protein PRIPAC_81760 [Pristionchus pacificus]|uniref:G protein-coupled receptor n=1 Tax=Pristionchus pacificus TaxID=54126 RepID=A0A2A6CC81_PRIPA|nr:hypothetical protein PRIPAC_81760 [Pristionchus pacificus]|eukprot:PDM75631.1 G protein-coupled receptor [Pristionchus pacificus]
MLMVPFMLQLSLRYCLNEGCCKKRNRSRNVLQSSVDFILGILLIRKTRPKVNPRPSMTGFTAVIANTQQTRVLPIEYTKCLVILKIIVFVYDFHLCFFFVAFPLFPCQGLFMQGLAAYIGMKTHATLVLNLTILSTMCVWYTCCLFQRYQSMLPAYHSYKLRRSEMYLGYFVLNLMMIVNPLLLAVTIKSDEILQRIQLRQTPMSWLLSTLSFKIYNDENSPLLAPFHLPLTIITFVLNTATTIFFANHTDRLMKARRDHVSLATVTMNTELVKNVQFESNVSTVGMVTPFVFWTVSMFFQFDASVVEYSRNVWLEAKKTKKKDEILNSHHSCIRSQ